MDYWDYLGLISERVENNSGSKRGKERKQNTNIPSMIIGMIYKLFDTLHESLFDFLDDFWWFLIMIVWIWVIWCNIVQSERLNQISNNASKSRITRIGSGPEKTRTILAMDIVHLSHVTPIIPIIQREKQNANTRPWFTNYLTLYMNHYLTYLMFIWCSFDVYLSYLMK